MSILKSIAGDLGRAPISGAMIVCLLVMVFISFLEGNFDRGILLLILANLHIIQREQKL